MPDNVRCVIELGHKIERLLHLPETGAGLVLKRAAFHAVFVAGVTQVKTASNALYLARREPEGLAVLYIAVALAVALTSFGLTWLLARRRPLWLLRNGSIGMALLLVLLWALTYVDFAPIYAVIYVFGEVYATTLSVLFWADASERFDVRMQKRIVGMLAAGGMLGAILGGGLVRPLAHLIPIETLLLIAAVSLLLAMPLLGQIKADPRRIQGSAHASRGRMRDLFMQSYPRTIALLVAVLAVLATLVDYHFRTTAAAILSEAELARLFGDLNALMGVAGLAFQSLLTSRMLASLGVFMFLALVPALVGLLATGAAVSGLFQLTILLKGVEMAGSYSLYQAGMQLLYNPLDTIRRHTLRPLIDGAAKKMGVALGGLCLLALSVSGVRLYLLPYIVACAVGILLVLRRVKSGYITTLDARLGTRRSHIHYDIDASDRVTREALMRALRSKSSREVLTALTVLERWSGFDLRPSLKHLLVHNSETVRLAAIERARQIDDPMLIDVLQGILATDSRRVRARAARAIAELDPTHAVAVLRPHLHDDDPGVRLAVIAALLPLEQKGVGPAHATLSNLVYNPSHPAPVRRELAKLLGELEGSPFIHKLEDLLADPEPSVRSLACESAGRLKRIELSHALVGLLRDRYVRASARQALAAFGDAIVPLLDKLLNDRSAALSLRLEVPRVLLAIGTESAASTLLFSNIHDDATLRYRIASALIDIKRRHPDISLDKQRVDEAALRRLHAYRLYRPMLRSLKGVDNKAVIPLRRAVSDRLSQNLEMALKLLGLVRDAELMEHIFAGIDERGSDMRAEAIELIDVAMAGDPMRGELLKHIESEAPQLSRPADEVRSLLQSRDSLLRGIAEAVARDLGIEVTTPGARGDVIDLEGESMDRPLVERLLALEHVDLFAKLSMDDLATLATICSERSAAPGEIIYRENDPGDAMFVITSGMVELLKGETIIMRHTRGESIGQVSIMDGGPRPVTARVAHGSTGATLLVIERGAFMDLLSDRFELVTGLFAVLAQRLRVLIDMSGSQDSTHGQ